MSQQQTSAGFTAHERSVLEQILHSVTCYNQRRVVALNGDRLKVAVGFVSGVPNVLATIPADIMLDPVTFGPMRGRSA